MSKECMQFSDIHISMARWSASGDTVSEPLGDAPDLSACLTASPRNFCAVLLARTRIKWELLKQKTKKEAPKEKKRDKPKGQWMPGPSK